MMKTLNCLVVNFILFLLDIRELYSLHDFYPFDNVLDVPTKSLNKNIIPTNWSLMKWL